MKYFLSVTLIFIAFLLTGQEQYSRAKVYLDGADLGTLSILGIDVHEGTFKKGVFFETDFTANEINRMRVAGFEVEISIEDVSRFYSERARLDGPLQIDRNIDEEWTVPQNWEYGSMAGYYTLDEVIAELDSMYAKYPDLISQRQAISTDTLTHEGRMQYWIKISDNPNTDESEPEVMYTSVHHAREVISVQQQIFFMWYLLENYNSDEIVKYIVDHTELYFVPIINPDGYQYNVTSNPDGGGMWRKNVRDNGDGTLGVDLNRNYGFFWGMDDEGSSPNTGDATYRGPAPFSEPEIKNMRDFCNAHEFQITLNYHSYSNLLLEPWGYTDELPADHELMHTYAAIMTMENNYSYGPGNTSIYPTNGGSDDWMYGEQTTKEAIFSYTPEVGGQGDGFWPEVPRIIPLCQEQMWQNITAARLLGIYAVVKDMSLTVNDQIDGYAKFEIKRLGMTEADSFTVSIEALDDNIIETGDPIIFEDLALLATALDSISYILDAGIESGTEFKYLLLVNNDGVIDSDTITKIYGSEVVVFYDDCETMDNWSSNKWANTTEDFVSPENSITDSPGGDYQAAETNIIELDTVIDLTNVKMAFLRFWTKWEIEEGYDYAQLLIKDTDAGDWTPLTGKYTRLGNNYQDLGKPVYDGFSDWVQEEINLTDFTGKEVIFRLVLRSDTYLEEDGYYFDDFTVSVVSALTGIELPEENGGLFISNAYPNPTNDVFRLQYELEKNEGAKVELFNAVGSLISKTLVDGNKGVLSLSLNAQPNGVYYYRLSNGTQHSKTLKIIKF